MFIASFMSFSGLVKPISTQSGQNRPDNFENILPTKAYLGKHLKEKCSSEATKQLSFKYFAKFPFIPKLSSKV